MKMENMALAGAQLAEKQGWAFVSAVSIARYMNIHSVTVSRSSSIKAILSSARKIVRLDESKYPRASIEMRIGDLRHNQRSRVLHALIKEESQ